MSTDFKNGAARGQLVRRTEVTPPPMPGGKQAHPKRGKVEPGLVEGAAQQRNITKSAFGVNHYETDISKIRGEEFRPGKTYERLSGEKKRRRLTGESMAYGTTAAAAGGTSAAIGAGRLAGTKTGQGVLNRAIERHGPQGLSTPYLQRAKKFGQTVNRQRGRYGAAGVALGATGVGAGVLRRYRSQEAEGISQGLGRMKGGEQYRSDQRRVRKNAGQAGTVVTYGRRLKRMGDFALRNERSLKTGGIAGGGAATGAAGVYAVQNRRRQRAQLQQRVRKDLRIVPTTKKERRRERTRNAAGGAAFGGLGSAGLTAALNRGGKGAVPAGIAGGVIGGGLNAALPPAKTKLVHGA